MATETCNGSVMVTEHSLARSCLSVISFSRIIISIQDSNVAKRGNRLTTDSRKGERYTGFITSLVKSITRPRFTILRISK